MVLSLTQRVDAANLGLMVLSCIVAFILPFEVFLFSYGVLGPLHYLTEIGWLHKKGYFTTGKYDYVFLFEYAIRNDDSAKDKLIKINALTYQLNCSCRKFIFEAINNKESDVVINFIKT